jgi:hypothetical protein
MEIMVDFLLILMKKNVRKKKEVKVELKIIFGTKINNMCSSGAHYMDWEELEELERVYKEEIEGTPKKYICSYSGLPSLLIYQNDEINK